MSALDGWDGWDGWDGSDGWDGWDGWSESGAAAQGKGGIGTAALIRNREAIVGIPPTPPWHNNLPRGSGDLPSPHDPAALDEWSPSVRARLLDSALWEGVKFEATGGRVGLTFDSKPVAACIRPPIAVFEKQCELTEAWAVHRSERAAEIGAQRRLGIGFWASIVPLHPRRTPSSLQVLRLAMEFSSTVVQRFKHELNCPRPCSFSPRVQPMLPEPGYSAMPSGHATQSHLVAGILSQLIVPAPYGDATRQARQTAWKEEAVNQLERLAERVATNRVVAGIHFPIDSVAGRLLGMTLSQFMLTRFSGAGGWWASSFNGEWAHLPPELECEPEMQEAKAGRNDFYRIDSTATIAAEQPWLGALWRRARKEWE